MNIISKFHNISLKKKLLLFSIIISLVPTLAIGLFSYQLSESMVRDKELDITIKDLQDADNLVASYLNNKRNIGINMSMDSDVITFLKNDETNDIKRLKSVFEVRKLLSDYRNTEGIESIYLFDFSGNVYTNDVGSYMTYASITSKKWYEKELSRNIYMWGDTRILNDVYTVPFYRLSKDLETRENVGLVVLNIKESEVYDLFSKFEVDYGRIIVLNQNNRVLSCKNKELLGKTFAEAFGVEVEFSKQHGYVEKKIENKEFFINYYKNQLLNFTYVWLEPMEQVLSVSRQIRQITIFLCLICLYITILFSLFLSNKVTKPMNKLVDVIQSVQQGNLRARVNFKAKDEVGLIGSAFDDMLNRLDQSIEEMNEAHRKQRQAEMKSLMLQINPHFLYNTLTSMIWLTNNNKKKEVIKMVSSLSTLFRIGISKGRQMITIEEEFKHVRSYLTIQKIRYKDEFVFEFEIDDNVKKLFSLKLLLQPLVENSIYHGIKNVEYTGLIVIKAYISKPNLVFEVMDNGDTVTEQDVDRMNKFLGDNLNDDSFGIGIRNVNERIKLAYGPEYGLSYIRENGFTIARIVIPVMEVPFE